jgi:exopolysaccharide production protein ExoZ
MGRLSNIQVLRAIAAFLVVVSHALHETAAMSASFGQPVLVPGIHPWTAAVDIFFIMSGFILLSISYEKFATPHASREFFIRRLVRAIPLYWLLTSLVLLTAMAMPKMLNVPIADLKQVLASYFFWPYPRGEGELRPVLALGWTMNLEFFFYILLALSLAFSRRVGLAFVGTALVGVVLLQQIFSFSADAMIFYGASMTLDFVLGMIIAVAYRCGLRLPVGSCVVAGLIGISLLLRAESADSSDLMWFVTISLPASLLVAAAVFGPQLPSRFGWQRLLILIGDACYSVYLLQPFILRPAAKAWVATFGETMSFWAYVFVASCLAVAAGVGCFLLFESPLTTALNRRIRAWEKRSGDPQPSAVPAE